MHKTLLAVTTAALFAGLTASPSLAQKPPKPGDATLTIAVAPNPVKFGNLTNVTGVYSTMAAGVALTLEAQPYPYTGKFDTAGTTTTIANGAYAFQVRPTIGTRYRVVTDDKPSTKSAEVAVAVRWLVGFKAGDTTPKKGQRVRFHGTVKPANPNAIVFVQRLTTAGWKNVKQTTLATSTTTSSSYSVRVTINRTGKYRTAILAANGYETGASRVRRLVVH